ncbi:MAG: hypothetical protein FJW31_11515 [Acidobacteria bacterium]|nr:hypothetical protein [Acidobacteriota bacterium]
MARYTAAFLYPILLAAQAPPARVELVDVMAVRATGDPRSVIHAVNVPAQPAETACDMLVAGAGAGGFAATLRAAMRGHTVCLTE